MFVVVRVFLGLAKTGFDFPAIVSLCDSIQYAAFVPLWDVCFNMCLQGAGSNWHIGMESGNCLGLLFVMGQ